MGESEFLPLPFQCPDLVMPISGKIPQPQHDNQTAGVSDFTILTEVEKKFLLGIKLFVCHEERMIGIDNEQWILWLSYRNEFILHMWKPLTGELKRIPLKHSKIIPELSEKDGSIKYLRIQYSDGMLFIINDDCNFMSELCQLFENAALGSPKIENQKIVPVEYIKTSSKEDLLRDSSITSRDSDSSISSVNSTTTPEDLEKQRKRRAIGSVSMRRLSLTGRTVKKPHGEGTQPVSPREQQHQGQTSENDELPSPPATQPELSTRRSVMSSVFGSITEDEDGA